MEHQLLFDKCAVLGNICVVLDDKCAENISAIAINAQMYPEGYELQATALAIGLPPAIPGGLRDYREPTANFYSS